MEEAGRIRDRSSIPEKGWVLPEPACAEHRRKRRSERSGLQGTEADADTPASAISEAFGDLSANRHCGMENQAGWEVSGQGSLPALAWQVEAVRRGPLVYALLTNMLMCSSWNVFGREGAQIRDLT